MGVDFLKARETGGFRYVELWGAVRTAATTDWEETDISDEVPATAKSVQIKFDPSATGATVGARKNGSAEERVAVVGTSSVGEIIFEVDVSGSKVIETKVAVSAATFRVVGYSESAAGGGSSASTPPMLHGPSGIAHSKYDATTEGIAHMASDVADDGTIWVVYTGTTQVNGSLYYLRSQDDGVTWDSGTITTLTGNDTFNNRAPVCKAFSNDIVYIAFGDRDSGGTLYRTKFVKTTNGGTSWSAPVTAESTGVFTTNIAMSAPTTSVIWIQGSQAPQRSTDSGATFTVQGTTTAFYDIHAFDDNILYGTHPYSTNPVRNKLRKSTDAGVTWSAGVDMGMELSGILAFSQTTVGVISSLSSGGGGTGVLHYYYTEDSGVTAQAITFGGASTAPMAFDQGSTGAIGNQLVARALDDRSYIAYREPSGMKTIVCSTDGLSWYPVGSVFGGPVKIGSASNDSFHAVTKVANFIAVNKST